MMHIPRSHLASTDPHDVLDGFLLTQVLGWLSETQARDRINVQQYCRLRTET